MKYRTFKITTGDTFTPRKVFPHHEIPLAGFQGHHRKALQSLRQMAFRTDLVLELRDSRAPISSINPLFDQVLGGKKKLILYTKTDLAKLSHSTIQQWHPHQDFMRVNSGLRKDCRRVLDYMRAYFESLHSPVPPLGYNVLITGMPNAGKSTLINTLRRRGLKNKRLPPVAKTGDQPGVTRNVSEIVRVYESPKINCWDTPGVFVPQVASSESILNLALVSAVHVPNVDPILLADYLLFHVNGEYPGGGKYPGPQTNDVHTLLRTLGNKVLGKGKLDETQVANMWLQRYSNGGICKLCLDDTSIENYNQTMELGRNMTLDLGPMKPNHQLRKRLMV